MRNLLLLMICLFISLNSYAQIINGGTDFVSIKLDQILKLQRNSNSLQIQFQRTAFDYNEIEFLYDSENLFKIKGDPQLFKDKFCVRIDKNGDVFIFEENKDITNEFEFEGDLKINNFSEFKINLIQNEGIYAFKNTVFVSNSCKSLPYSENLNCSYSSQKINFFVHPNPIYNEATLKSLSTELYDFILLDSSGKTILSNMKNKGDVVIDLSSQPSGVYFINIISNNELTNLKLIKIN